MSHLSVFASTVSWGIGQQGKPTCMWHMLPMLRTSELLRVSAWCTQPHVGLQLPRSFFVVDRVLSSCPSNEGVNKFILPNRAVSIYIVEVSFLFREIANPIFEQLFGMRTKGGNIGRQLLFESAERAVRAHLFPARAQVPDTPQPTIVVAPIPHGPWKVELCRQSHGASLINVQRLVYPTRWKEHSLACTHGELKHGFPSQGVGHTVVEEDIAIFGPASAFRHSGNRPHAPTSLPTEHDAECTYAMRVHVCPRSGAIGPQPKFGVVEHRGAIPLVHELRHGTGDELLDALDHLLAANLTSAVLAHAPIEWSERRSLGI
mmetsp:Transcript_19580/g.50207  ORF Transcript_19580/g.50207 Transcript_19580/m.50207 type:complete len:318 (-) Transcript_19580:28-981(-)